jgi:hypothetical protein
VYTKDDLKPLNVERHTVKNQHLYFGSAGATAPAICSRIVEGALILGSQNVNIFQEGDWSLIVSDVDWLSAKSDSKSSPKNAFSGLFPFPEAGINCCRFEYFASSISLLYFLRYL